LEKVKIEDFHVRYLFIKGGRYGYYIVKEMEDLCGNVDHIILE